MLVGIDGLERGRLAATDSLLLAAGERRKQGEGYVAGQISAANRRKNGSLSVHLGRCALRAEVEGMTNTRTPPFGAKAN